MKLIGHRGFADSFPDNTLIAIHNAVDYADMIELDLRRCRSGEIIVIHDGIIDAVTNSRGRVSDLTATELGQFDVLDSGQGIPTLADVLSVVPPDIGLNLELKAIRKALRSVAYPSVVAVGIAITLWGHLQTVAISSGRMGFEETRLADVELRAWNGLLVGEYKAKALISTDNGSCRGERQLALIKQWITKRGKQIDSATGITDSTLIAEVGHLCMVFSDFLLHSLLYLSSSSSEIFGGALRRVVPVVQRVPSGDGGSNVAQRIRGN